MPVYLSTILISMHVIQGVLGVFQLPTFIQTLSKDKHYGQNDPLFTLPTSVTNVDNLKQFTPLKQDMKPKKLYKRLGNNFNSFWMSVDLPEDLLETHVRQKLNTDLKEDLNTVNLSHLENSLRAKYSNGYDYNTNNSSDITNGVLELVKSWLVQKASCPVYYIWEDLGLLYWPRWVRRGLCSLKDTPLFKITSQSASKIPKLSHCSWPPGMHCVPAEANQLKILRWQCRNKKSLNNLNRFRLPDIRTPPNFSNRLKRHDQVTAGSKHTNENQHFHNQFGTGLYEARPLASNRTKLFRNNNNRQERLSRDNRQTSLDLRKRQANSLSKTQTNRTGAQDKHGNEKTQKQKQKRTTNKQRQADDNETENWNSINWKERRRALNLKCKWIKVPYPVTDDCFCSC